MSNRIAILSICTCLLSCTSLSYSQPPQDLRQGRAPLESQASLTSMTSAISATPRELAISELTEAGYADVNAVILSGEELSPNHVIMHHAYFSGGQLLAISNDGSALRGLHDRENPHQAVYRGGVPDTDHLIPEVETPIMALLEEFMRIYLSTTEYGEEDTIYHLVIDNFVFFINDRTQAPVAVLADFRMLLEGHFMGRIISFAENELYDLILTDAGLRLVARESNAAEEAFAQLLPARLSFLRRIVGGVGHLFSACGCFPMHRGAPVTLGAHLGASHGGYDEDGDRDDNEGDVVLPEEVFMAAESQLSWKRLEQLKKNRPTYGRSSDDDTDASQKSTDDEDEEEIVSAQQGVRPAVRARIAASSSFYQVDSGLSMPSRNFSMQQPAAKDSAVSVTERALKDPAPAVPKRVLPDKPARKNSASSKKTENEEGRSGPRSRETEL